MKNKIITDDELDTAIETCSKDHPQKDIALLLLLAMNDWPTPDQYNLRVFCKEVTNYFGIPLTVQKLESKQFNGENAWEIEASGSIIDLINISTKHLKESNFDKIIDSCLKHFEYQLN
jgi:hypothetical protein